MKAFTEYILGIISGIRNLYLHANLFMVGSVIILLMGISFAIPEVWDYAIYAWYGLAALVFIQFILLFLTNINVKALRVLPEILSLGDEQKILFKVTNLSPITLRITAVETRPYQLGVRDASHQAKLKAGQSEQFTYSIRPVSRGIYVFGDTFFFLRTFFPLIERRIIQHTHEELTVFPSVIQMRKFELYASKRLSNDIGVKRTRRLGHGSEFEQIKQYVPGDDPRTINWKATARTGHIMTNHYQEEKSQPVYQILDTSRNMKMPFNQLTLLDHSINSALALSNVILKKGDKTGLIGFDKKVNSFLEANNSSYQLKAMLSNLYNQKISSYEPDYELLFYQVRKHLTKRSFCILYTNFESIYAMERVLPQLRAISKRHLLLVVLFENTELSSFSEEGAKSLYDIYEKTLAKKVLREKKLIHAELERQGIMNISVTAETLTADVINKYLEIKSRGAL